MSRFLNSVTGIPNPSPKYKMEGYLYEELGPVMFEGKGKEALDQAAAEFEARGKFLRETNSSGGCPMSHAFSAP